MWNAIVMRKVNGVWCVVVIERDADAQGAGYRKELAVYGSRMWMIDVTAMEIDFMEGL